MKHDGLPLSALLSQALVAFTIEFDNEAERRMRHRTTRHGGGSLHAPWLVSLAMWSNCMQFVGEEGIHVGELEKVARTKTNLNGMVRWGYIVVSPDEVIRATAAGRKAQEIWRPLFAEIEERWQTRFGNDAIDRLRTSLRVLVSRIGLDLPNCLPILGYGLFSKGPDQKRGAAAGDDSDLSLPALLSRALLAFAMEFERESDLSLAIYANVLRRLDQTGVRVRDIPRLTGVSKEAISVALGIVRKMRLALEEPDPAGSRAKVVRLTPKGVEAQDACRRLIDIVQERWQARFGEDCISNLRASLEKLAGEPLFRGLEPFADGWRAQVRKPDTLPHYPMVLHRGGFPDGS